MLRKWLTMLLIVTTAISSGANLIERGNALGRIFIPAHPELPVIFAVQELQKHLKAMTNVDILLAWRVANNSDSGFILTVRPESEWKGKESSQTFRITETTKPVPRVTISGNTSLAVLYGIYQYLSDQGIRWFEPMNAMLCIHHHFTIAAWIFPVGMIQYLIIRIQRNIRKKFTMNMIYGCCEIA